MCVCVFGKGGGGVNYKHYEINAIREICCVISADFSIDDQISSRSVLFETSSDDTKIL